jgi:hypothetical protein
MKYTEILDIASKHLHSLKGQNMDVVDIAKPPTIDYARHLAKVVSKLSPLVGNMIEYNACIELNKLDWKGFGKWERQDPGFPDTIFIGKVAPAPGIEIKTWFPLATEITARFKDSVNFFNKNQTNVALVAWLPEFIIYGKPKIIDVWVGSAKSLAIARDSHYHNPPDYLVFEPEDTTSRTSNLQQTNTNGYKFQGTAKEFEKASKIVKKWGTDWKDYSHEKKYQNQVKQLIRNFPYRLDTNFAKIDRIQHAELEAFKTRVLNQELFHHDIKTWANIIGDEEKDIMQLIKDLIQVAK